MKKLLAMLLALAMGCTMLAACGDSDSSSKEKDNTSSVTESVEDSKEDDASEGAAAGDDESKDDESKDDESKDDSSQPALSGDIILEDVEEIETDERLFETLIAEIAKGEFTINANIEQAGMSVEMYLTTDGKNTYIDMNVMGMAVTALSNADGDYLLDTANKKYYLDPTGSMGMSSAGEEMADSMTSLDGLTYASTATATINGGKYTVEKYLNNATSIEVSYIFNENGDLVLVGNDDMYMPFEIKASVDTSKLSVDGYTAMTDEEFVAWSATFMGA